MFLTINVRSASYLDYLAYLQSILQYSVWYIVQISVQYMVQLSLQYIIGMWGVQIFVGL